MADRDEQQWDRHNRDEALAREAQQRRAGPDHRPVAGPGLYGDHATNINVRNAIGAERERWVQQAVACASEPALRETFGDISERDREVARAVAEAIIAAIRSEQGGDP